MELLYKDEVFKIVGAAMEVYNELGPGFLEAVYQEALEIEFLRQAMPFDSQKPLPITYKGQRLNKSYVADFLVYEKIIVELKALERLSGTEEAQVLNYLKATGLRVAVLLNFGRVGELEWKRYIK
jgi:GxxExxY protein